MLKLIPAERATLEQICEYAWVTQENEEINDNEFIQELT